FYNEKQKILSKSNLALAMLAYRITSLSNIERRYDICSKFAYSYYEAFRTHISLVVPTLAADALFAAVESAYIKKPPSKEDLLVFKYFREATDQAFGTMEHVTAKHDEAGIIYHDRIAYKLMLEFQGL
ncbi:hypothetical protein PFISCL1PPCAC_24338, partial [Pristionchus fissidentatus]